ncbi:MAG TPA: Ig-like domain-containing protein [Vicinamibacterales bacterium]|nr:Ig-like domain-containing protein [Vicinamibacterales bacterium]
MCVVAAVFLSAPRASFAQTSADRLCDPAAEDCRAILIDYIRNETVEIDVAFWFMEDARYTAELTKKWQAGVPIRVIIDPRANATEPVNVDRLAELQSAGMPMRKRTASGILHWKTMIFAGQGVVEFSGANYSADAWHPLASTPYTNYIDEAIFFAQTPSIVQSFMTKYDDLWTNTTSYANYANVSGPLTRSYPTYTKDPELNFPPGESYATRAIQAYKAETQKIDVTMYRITDARHADQMIAAVQRGVPVRLLMEPEEYRNHTRAWDSYNIDRMYMAGVQLKQRAHAGLNHQKTVLLYGQGMVIFGSSNWSEASDDSQQEHNYFTHRPELFQWFVDQFERKWNNSAGVVEYVPFVPLPPDKPSYRSPANAAAGVDPTAVKLKWYGGPWGQKYDVYFGTSGTPPLVASDLQLGPSESQTENQAYTLPTTLLPGTTYYWQIVTKTMANLTKAGPVYAFTTAGETPAPPVNGTLGPGDVLLYAATAATKAGGWTVLTDGSAASAAAMWQPNLGAAKVTTPLAKPANYFDLSFSAQAGIPYRLWIRGRADADSYRNDSVYAQFSNSLNGSGAAAYRIGTTSALSVVLEDCDGCGVHAWGWQDDGYGAGVLGAPITFDATGPQTIRIQAREDGIRIDQIMLSPALYLSHPPGTPKDDATIYEQRPDPPDDPIVTLVRQPYLQQVTATSAMVVWTTAQPGPAEVHYATGGGASTPVPAVTTFMPSSATGVPNYYQHVAALTGLSASTTYAYDILVQGVDLNPAADQFTTAPPTGTGTVRFVALGDSGVGSTAQQQIGARIGAETFDFALHAGDIAYGSADGTGDGSFSTFENWFFSTYAGWLRSHPIFPADGNHDSRPSNGNGTAYLADFVLPTNGATAAFPDDAERFYSFDYGPVHVDVLDTETAFQDTSRRADQLAWLAADLAATTQPWKIAVFHRPPYSSGGEHGSDLDVRAAFDPIFEQYGVQLAISGHEHDYERTIPIDVSNPAAPGVTYVVTGGGGAPLYPAASSAWTAYAESRYEYLRGTVDSCTLDLDAVNIDGAVFDHVSLSRCASGPDTENPVAVMTAPSEGSTIDPNSLVAVAASDNVAVSRVELWVDGAAAATRTAGPYDFPVAGLALSPGPHTLQAHAVDGAGNVGLSPLVNVTMDTSPPPPTDVVLYATDASAIAGRWVSADDPTAAGGARLHNPNSGAAKIKTASPAPADYFELTFTAEANVPYHLWMRGKADSNAWSNDSVFVQFSDTVDGSGNPIDRIGTTSATDYNLEDCDGCGEAGWGWQDNGWGVGVLGPDLIFATEGTHTLRIQVREDGLSLDQIVLSPATYRTSSPGALKNDTTILPKFVTPDTVAPVVSITAPLQGVDVNGVTAVAVDATDNVGVARVELWVGGVLGGTNATAPFGFAWDTSTLVPGSYTILAKAYDAAGNPGTSTPVTVNVVPTPPDTEDPVAAMTAPAEGTTINSQSSIGVDATDNVGVVTVDLLVDGAVTASTTSAPYAFAVSGLALTAGPHTLQGRASDAAGNTGLTAVVNVTMDTTPPPPSDIVLYAAETPAIVGRWETVADATAAGGMRIHNPNAGAAKIKTASPAPADYFELTFTAQANVPYHLWMRGRADGNSWSNDSAFVQFSDTVDGLGNPVDRIGTTSAAEYNLEDCDGCGESGWGWQDNGWGVGVLGPDLVFATGGTHTLRIQVREDGLSLDQIVLSPVAYRTSSPGALKNDATILPAFVAPPDTIAPAVSITAPLQGTDVSGVAAVAVDATDNVGVARVELWVGGVLAGTNPTVPFGFAWNTGTLVPGAYTLVAKAYDEAGNTASSTPVTVNVVPGPPDTEDPVAAMTAPAEGATINSQSSIGVDATDNVGVVTVDLLVDGTMAASTTSAPYAFAVSGLALTAGPHTLQGRASDAAGNTGLTAVVNVTMDTTPPPPSDIVLYAAETPAIVGQWETVADATAAGGARLHNLNAGAAKIKTASATPADYVELTFTAEANVPYHLWMRGKADGNGWSNDSVFVQFSDTVDESATPIYRIGTTSAAEYNLEDCSGCGESGWGWQDNGWGVGVLGPDLVFATGGTHTVRIQVREDGLSLDQVLLSPTTYRTVSPGALKNDTTILGK